MILAKSLRRLRDAWNNRHVKSLTARLNDHWLALLNKLSAEGWDVAEVKISQVPKFASTYMTEEYLRVRFTRDDMEYWRFDPLMHFTYLLQARGVHKILRHRGAFQVYRIEGGYYLGVLSYAVA